METIVSIEIVKDLQLAPNAAMRGSKGARLGMFAMLNALKGYGGWDGYKITTSEQTYHLLIENGQNCCEHWGYFESHNEDEWPDFIGAELIEVSVTDKALNDKRLEESGYYGDAGGIFFVNFRTAIETIQFVVYNAHNGYYGHGILFAKGNDILNRDTL